MSEASESKSEWHNVVCPTCKSAEHLMAQGPGNGRLMLLQRHDDDKNRYLQEIERPQITVEMVTCINCGWYSGPGFNPFNDLIKEV